MVINAHTISRGEADGEAVLYKGPFSFMGDLDPFTGKITVPRHELEGLSLAGKIFIFTTGKGSSSGDCAAWVARERGNAPAAIICLESEPVLSGAVIAAGIPAMDRPEADIFEMIKTGDFIKMNATEGTIRIAIHKEV